MVGTVANCGEGLRFFEALPAEVLLVLYKDKLRALARLIGLTCSEACLSGSSSPPRIGVPSIDGAPLWVRVALIDEMLSCPSCREAFLQRCDSAPAR